MLQDKKSAERNTAEIDPRLLRETIVAIGASTGGTEALLEVLRHLPLNFPGIVIAQHMPETFTPIFAQRLDDLCRIVVKEAKGGEKIEPGTAFLAPGHSHLLVRKINGCYVTELSDAPPVGFCRPSVDVLFRSVAVQARGNAIGIILTGMGKDGAAGMLTMHSAGAWTLAQDRESSLIYGMPREAVAMGGVDEICPLTAIAGRLLAKLRNVKRT